MAEASGPEISVVIPTWQRSEVVLATVRALRAGPAPAFELLVVDQTRAPPVEAAAELARLDASGDIRWIRLEQPSIPAAMNRGLLDARADIVLFLDDDVEPGPGLLDAHLLAQRERDLVAGQVLQPGESPLAIGAEDPFVFRSSVRRDIGEFMGGNFSIKRVAALALGGFDENFLGAAYRFEAEFAHRYVQRFGGILFEPEASIHHLQVATGGTRAHGHHLRSAQPAHSVGAYYYLLRVRPRNWWLQAAWRPLRAVRTRHHLSRPWWIPVTLLAEFRGFRAARRLAAQAPRLLPPVESN